jgi:hypothetical protein
MTTAEATPGEAPPHDEAAAGARSIAPPSSPLVSAGWLLRATAFAAVAAGTMGVIIGPGLHGNASEPVVELTDRVASVLTYFLVELLITALLWGALELTRARTIGVFVRAALVGGAAASVAMSAPALRDRLPAVYAVLLSASATVTAIAGGYVAARAPHTRALAGVLFALSFAAMARLGAWELATAAGERASVQLFGWSRLLATAGVVLEASAQMVAVTWLGTRSRSAGQLGSMAALLAAVVVTWGVARGMHSAPALWQSVMHTALADAPGVPPPALDAIATFLVPASLLLGLVSAAQPKQVAAVVAGMALALVSRGAFDAPLHALCVAVAAQWAALACVDQRSMWRTLIDDRNRRMAEDGEDGMHGDGPARPTPPA